MSFTRLRFLARQRFVIIFGNFALYLDILLLYLGISHYIGMFAIIFFNFAFNIRNWSYIFGLDNKYIRLIDYCPSWRAIENKCSTKSLKTPLIPFYVHTHTIHGIFGSLNKSSKSIYTIKYQLISRQTVTL